MKVTNEEVADATGVGEEPSDIAARARENFTELTEQYDDVFDSTDSLTLNNPSIAYVVGELQPYALIECDGVTVADAFETESSRALITRSQIISVSALTATLRTRFVGYQRSHHTWRRSTTA